jgi:hypothetical protein
MQIYGREDDIDETRGYVPCNGIGAPFRGKVTEEL